MKLWWGVVLALIGIAAAFFAGPAAAQSINVDLGEGVFEAIAEGDERVINAHSPEAEHENKRGKNAENNESGRHGGIGETRGRCVEAETGARTNGLQRG